MPIQTTLKNKPQLMGPVLSLIESNFGYESSFKYKEDFAPLMHESNFEHCHLSLGENDEIIGHVGVLLRKISVLDHEYTLAMLGGIAVNEKFQGKGYFKDLINHVIQTYESQVSGFLLWSDLHEMYKKFGFSLCGTQFVLSSESPTIVDIEKTTYSKLSSDEKKEIQHLYRNGFQKHYLTLNRSEDEWKKIELIKSANLFIQRKEEKINGYFFQNKGMDLQNIIYEYGHSEDFVGWLKDISALGEVWSGVLDEEAEVQYQFLFRPASQFTDFVKTYTREMIHLQKIDYDKDTVTLMLIDEELELHLDDFLTGLFGPGRFDEVSYLPPLFISGLDSI
ncbi:MAG: GNAT family N-acetyltransferase [Bacteriovoracaceae bacterium]